VKKFIPLTLQANRVRKGDYASDDSYGLAGMFRLLAPNTTLLCVVSSGPASRGNDTGWEHVSVSSETRCPTWEEMCFVKDLFWGEDELVVQYHPPKSEHVNFHPHCLHLWKSLRVPMPAPPSILVGPKTVAGP
jgi:hypothetical protein